MTVCFDSEPVGNVLVKACIRHRATFAENLLRRLKWCMDWGLTTDPINPRRVLLMTGYTKDTDKAHLYPCEFDDGGMGCIMVISKNLKEGSVAEALTISDAVNSISRTNLLKG